VRDHASALDYDLMTRTGRTLAEYLGMGADGMSALAHFCRHLDADSATWREVAGHADYAAWSDRLMAVRLLADLYDLVNVFRWQYVGSRSKKKPKKPKPYPTPWSRPETKHFGKDPVKVSKFWDWWERKGGKNRKRGGGDG